MNNDLRRAVFWVAIFIAGFLLVLGTLVLFETYFPRKPLNYIVAYFFWGMAYMGFVLNSILPRFEKGWLKNGKRI